MLKQFIQRSGSQMIAQAVQSMFKQASQCSSGPTNVRPAEENSSCSAAPSKTKLLRYLEMSETVTRHGVTSQSPETALHVSLPFEATAFKQPDIFKTNFCSFLKIIIPQRPKQSCQRHFMTNLYKILNTPKVYIPVPGIEPEPPGWKPGILATRPYRTTDTSTVQASYTCAITRSIR